MPHRLIAVGDELGIPFLNDAGHVAYVDGDQIVIDRGGSKQVVVGLGDEAAGVPSNPQFDRLLLLRLGPTGDVAFEGAWTESSTGSDYNSRGLWLFRDEQVEVLSFGGQAVPGADASTLFTGVYRYPPPNHSGVHLTADGDAIFTAEVLSGGARQDSIWIHDGVALREIARENQPAPRSSGETNYGTLDHVVASTNGAISFLEAGTHLWAGTEDALSVLAYQGMDAPGTSGRFKMFSPLTSISQQFNSDGEIAIYSGLREIPGHPIADWGIWSNAGSELRLIARYDTQAPGTPPGVRFDRGPHLQALTDLGEVVFVGFLDGVGVDASNDTGIWVGDHETLRLVVRDGDSVPNSLEPAVFKNVSPQRHSVPHAAQHTVFSATVGSPSSNADDAWGIWVSAPDGTKEKLVAVGDEIDGYGTITGFSSTGVNNRGDMAILASFENNTRGLFVYRVLPVPEPVALASFATALFGVMLRRPSSR